MKSKYFYLNYDFRENKQANFSLLPKLKLLYQTFSIKLDTTLSKLSQVDYKNVLNLT